jgi:hypothetical protein
VVELRACRTFVDHGGEHAWTVGSELSGDEQKDGSFEYTMVFFAERELGRGRSKLLERKLGSDPQTLHTFDVPAAAEISPGTFVLTARYRGALHAWMLDAEKRPVGNLRTYTGGQPTRVRFADDGRAFGLLSQQSGGEHGLRVLDVADGNVLPASLRELVIPGGGASKTEPSFVRAGSVRLLGYVAGPAGQGSFQVVPVDAALAPLAPALRIAPDEAVVEAQVFALPSGKLLAAYLRGGSKPAFVSKVLTCG